MEQKNLTFQDILSECLNNPNGEVANTELDENARAFFNEANAAMDIIENNWNSLKKAHADGLSTLEWTDEKMDKLVNKN